MKDIFKFGNKPLVQDNLFYEGSNALIYRDNDYLYKIYLNKKLYNKYGLKYLISNYDKLKDYAIIPTQIIKVDRLNGIKMKYVPSINLSKFMNNKDNLKVFIKIIKKLSDNLKILNKYGIHISDFHGDNILIDQNNNPLYVDLDEASINESGSMRICVMAYNLHNIAKKNNSYEEDLIRFGNLDRECLALIFINYITNSRVELLNYDQFQDYMDYLSYYFGENLISIIKKVKTNDNSMTIVPYEYYIGDYIQEDKLIETLKLTKRIK